MNNLRNRVINWVLVEKPALAAKIIRKLTSSGRSSKGVAKKEHHASPTPEPLTRDNGLRAANIAAGVPGAQ